MMFRKTSFGLMTAAGLLSASGVANAQGGVQAQGNVQIQGSVQTGGSAQGGTGFVTDPNAGAVPPPPPGSAVMAPPPPPGQPVVMVVQPPPEVDHGRFRMGWEVGAGYLITAGVRGPALIASVRLGWQFNHLFGLYYQGALPLGIAGGTVIDDTGRSRDVGGLAISVNNSVIPEFTLGHIFHAGLGPSIDYFAGGICATDSGGGYCYGSAGTYFGIDGRLALTFGNVRPGRRAGFQLALDLHPTFTPSGVFFFSTIGVGMEWY